MLAAHFSLIRWVHISCVLLSGSLFMLRGVLRLNSHGAANAPSLRRLSYLIDSTLLASAVLLTVLIRQYPLTSAWLTVKVALVFVYIG